jgi:Domain of unknown function (DUF4126)
MLDLLLAVLSASAAAGIRTALPLLAIELVYGSSMWGNFPFLSLIAPPILLGILVSWSVLELSVSKHLQGQRILQVVELMLSPLVGGMMSWAIASTESGDRWLMYVLSAIGGLLALVLQLVQLGWIYRLKRLPLWATFAQDALCVCLVLFAFGAPQQGGLIALLLLWLAIRSAAAWRNWYVRQANPGERHRPRRHKQDPD